MIRLGILSELLGGNPRSDPYVEPVVRVRRQLAERGIELVANNPDLVLVDSAKIESLDFGCPLILLDKTDGGMLWWDGSPHADRARHWLRSPSVLGMLKMTRYRQADAYNRPWAEGSVHIQRIYDAANGELSVAALPPALHLDEGTFQKIALGYGFWAFHGCADLADGDIDVDAPRDIDVFCAGTLDYASPGVTHHRRRAMTTLERLARLTKLIVKGRVLSHRDYCSRLRRSRICVSPWGWGETTIRDYEAMYAGCVLIKPRTDFIDSWPAIDERHYVSCRVDFADLPERVLQVLNRWQEYQAMRLRNRQLLTAARSPDALADLLAAALSAMIHEID